MNGQRSSFCRGTLALLLCAILLSTIFCTAVYAGRQSTASEQGDPSASQVLAASPAENPDGVLPGDGSGNGDPPNVDGDPDDYDKILVQVLVSFVRSPLFLIW